MSDEIKFETTIVEISNTTYIRIPKKIANLIGIKNTKKAKLYLKPGSKNQIIIKTKEEEGTEER